MVKVSIEVQYIHLERFKRSEYLEVVVLNKEKRPSTSILDLFCETGGFSNVNY